MDLSDITDKFNRGCDAYQKAMVAVSQANLPLYEREVRTAAGFVVGALEWALKIYLRRERRDQMLEDDRLKLRQPSFHDLMELMKRYADPSLEARDANRLYDYRELLRNAAEHDAAVPPNQSLVEAVQQIRQLILTYLAIPNTDLKPIGASLSVASSPQPPPAKLAATQLKEYLAENREIHLRDFVMGEVEKLHVALSAEHFPTLNATFNAEVLLDRVQEYERLSATMQALMVTGCYWNKPTYTPLWVESLERLVDTSGMGNTALIRLKLYPVLLLLYSGGIAALRAGHYDLLAALLTAPCRNRFEEEQPLVLEVNTTQVATQEIAQLLPDMRRKYTPLSDRLHEILRDPLREFLPSDITYDSFFDRFEYLLALVHTDLRIQQQNSAWGPLGRYKWRRHYGRADDIVSTVTAEASKMGAAWPPLKASLFGGTVERFQEAVTAYQRYDDSVHWI